MEPWYRVATPRKEVREGRSFNPDEFAIALLQVVTRTAPEDYREPKQFFARTCFTRALPEHAGMVLRRLSGKTDHTAPVLTLITQFGGGKTHTLTALYHLGTSDEKASGYSGISDRVPPNQVRGLLPFSPGDPFGVPAEVASGSRSFAIRATVNQPGRAPPERQRVVMKRLSLESLNMGFPKNGR